MLRLDRSVGVNHNCWSKKLLPIIRVGAFISVVSFFFLLLFLPKAFPIKRPKNISFELGQLLEGVFYLKMEKHLGFLRKFLLHKKNARSGGSDRQIIYRLYTKLLTLNTLGTKWFWLLSNSWILLVHNSLIQNGCFFNISASASLVIGNIWSRRIAFRNQFFSKSQRPIDSKRTPKTNFDHNQYKIRCQTQNCCYKKMTQHIFVATDSI